MKVPLLSCVQVLIHVRELRKEIEQFLRHRGSGIAEHLEKEFIMSDIGYLSDIFSHLNDLTPPSRERQ